MKQNKNNPKRTVAAIIAAIFISVMAVGQIPPIPAGKYNTTNYPEDRKAIEALDDVHDNSKYLNDDFIAVGPEGKVSFGFEQWMQGFKDDGATFKSVKAVPGTYILRIYNGDAAVKNVVLETVFATPKGDKSITVILRESLIKQTGKWYLVGAQVTKLLSKEDQANLKLGSPTKQAVDAPVLVPPPGKYNTTNYPEERKAIDALRMLPDSAVHLNDDYIAVGPEGHISYGLEQWQQGFKKTGVKFKVVSVVPGASITRVYNGDAAVKYIVAEVLFDTPIGDMNITVVRTETYIKQNGHWYFVGGQGTKLLSKEELGEMMK
jgi:hypothetical protein